jgi:hypothetical protein
VFTLYSPYRLVIDFKPQATANAGVHLDKAGGNRIDRPR